VAWPNRSEQAFLPGSTEGRRHAGRVEGARGMGLGVWADGGAGARMSWHLRAKMKCAGMQIEGRGRKRDGPRCAGML
jgi:hypothetical protein